MSEHTKEANRMLDENFGLAISDSDYHHFTDSDSEGYPVLALDFLPIFPSIILLDDKKKFLSLMEKKYPRTDAEKFPRYCAVNYFMQICEFAAVSCAAALLEGEACVTADPNQYFMSGRYPLHYAAAQMSYAMVDLLLRHGARTDVETTKVEDYEDSCMGGLLPLNVALETLRTHCYLLDWNWKPYPPLLKMICIFCLPQMKAPLEICRMLASNMADDDVVKVFHSYCMRGDIIEIAALLMISRKKLIDTSSGSIPMCKTVAREIEHLTNHMIKLLFDFESPTPSKKRIMRLRDALFVLGVFENNGEAIDSYVKTVGSHTSKAEVVDEMKMLLAAGRVPVVPRDINLKEIDCEDANTKLATELLEKMLQSPNQGHSSVSVGYYSGCLAQRVLTESKKQRWAMSGFFSVLNPVFQDGDSKWSRKNIIPSKSYRPKHEPPPTLYESSRPKHESPLSCSGPVDKMASCHYSVRGYASLARAVKKLPRCI